MEKSKESAAWLARRDGKVVAGFGPFSSADRPPSGGVAFHFQNFELSDPQPWKIPSRIERGTAAEIAAHFPAPPLPEIAWATPDAAPFSRVFQEIMAAIQAGAIEKTVPVVTEIGRAGGLPGPAIAAAMLRQPAPLHSYGWFGGDSGFAGATPELLFSLRGKSLQTMALAGTARSDDRGAFAVDEKEILEHEYVARTLVAKLVGLGPIRREAREILDLGSIVHFLTWISLDLEVPLTPDELIRRLHPTPALGSLPRTAATLAMLYEWRQRLGCPAGFGAPFGLWDRGEFHAIVAIRGIWWNGLDLALPAGCGIIEASRLVSEWRELRLKRQAVKNFL